MTVSCCSSRNPFRAVLSTCSVMLYVTRFTYCSAIIYVHWNLEFSRILQWRDHSWSAVLPSCVCSLVLREPRRSSSLIWSPFSTIRYMYQYLLIRSLLIAQYWQGHLSSVLCLSPWSFNTLVYALMCMLDVRVCIHLTIYTYIIYNIYEYCFSLSSFRLTGSSIVPSLSA